MTIKCGKYCGFCPGVNFTVNKALEQLQENNFKVYCLGDIVHNENVINNLQEKGMITVNSILDVPDNSKIIFRAHGATMQDFQLAHKKNLEIIDLTCEKIQSIRRKIDAAKCDSFIIIIGKKNHPEIIGNASFIGKNYAILEDDEDIDSVCEKFLLSKLNKIYIIAQTTFSSLKFDILVSKIKDIIDINNYEIAVDKTICNTTELRQSEAKELSQSVDKMIVIGGKKSSNTKELAIIAEKYCKNVYLVQNINDLNNISFSSEDVIGITAGASTPNDAIDSIKEFFIKNYSAHEEKIYACTV